ncbi:unnamed protein product [Phyllotreta striolata]|uniref:Dipeptidyl peptidase 3 n=1 Tax=Phyllotreta striolata TaxID=444603 RepID=A0A9N9XT86_PHYSR|nr:unnamed protein product [Phyllotreta striolata]
MDEKNRAKFTYPTDQPVVALEVKSSFENLTQQEKMYAHNMSKACWTGGLITLLQTSPESGPIFVILHKLFYAQTPEVFQKNALQFGFTILEIKSLFVYAGALFTNSGNYKGFGDLKFIPDLPQERFEKMLQMSPAWAKIEPIWKKYKDAVYDTSLGKLRLDLFPDGVTTYFSKNITYEDIELVQEWMDAQGMDYYNTRLFKIVTNTKVTYEVMVASEEQKFNEAILETGETIRIIYGDYSPIMAKMIKHLQRAAKYTRSEQQNRILDNYITSFRTGSLEAHKYASKLWVQDKSPPVESYMGFIESYRDPVGLRGEFEGFVAIVNKEMTVKFATLVCRAEKLIKLLPWSRAFEKDSFNKPDFTSLDVVTFAGSGIPAGINIPNYEDVRKTEGFKNVSLGNVIPASYQQTVIPFLCAAEANLLQKLRIPAFELQVGLHELLGHGSGKIFKRERDGSYNFPPNLMDPLTGKPLETFYDYNDTYESKFGGLSSTYDECRAEAVGLLLSLEPEVLSIFGFEGEKASDVSYVNWLSLVWAGVSKCLEFYDTDKGWFQSHAEARFVLTRVLVQSGVVVIQQPSEDDLMINLDRYAIGGAGKSAIAEFLLKLQVYKATGNLEKATELYNHFAKVEEPWLSWRDIILMNKQPRKMFVQVNTQQIDNTVLVKTYPSTIEGLIMSWVERFSNPLPMHEAIMELTLANERHFEEEE